MGREVAFVGEAPKIVEYMPAEGFWLNVWQQLANSGCGVLHVTSIDNVLYIELAWWLKPPPDTIPQETTKMRKFVVGIGYVQRET